MVLKDLASAYFLYNTRGAVCFLHVLVTLKSLKLAVTTFSHSLHHFSYIIDITSLFFTLWSIST